MIPLTKKEEKKDIVNSTIIKKEKVIIDNNFNKDITEFSTISEKEFKSLLMERNRESKYEDFTSDLLSL